MDRSSKPQSKPRQAGQGPANSGRKQQGQKIPRRDLLGPAGDPAEGRRNISPKKKR